MKIQVRQISDATKDMEAKVKASFVEEFGYEPKKITINETDADADEYYCRLTSVGVKKGSWRINKS